MVVYEDLDVGECSMVVYGVRCGRVFDGGVLRVRCG